MHALILVGWLGAAAASEPPRTVVVESHPLANAAFAKAARPEERNLQQALSARARHAMGARLRADGSVEYACDLALPDLRRLDRRIEEER